MPKLSDHKVIWYKFSLKIYLIFVLSSGLVCWPLFWLLERHFYYKSLAKENSSRVKNYRIDGGRFYPRFFDQLGNEVSVEEGWADFRHRHLAEQYDRASRRPWEHVPDESK